MKVISNFLNKYKCYNCPPSHAGMVIKTQLKEGTGEGQLPHVRQLKNGEKLKI